MDIQNYISSGILEQYVLGDLSAQQQLEVEAFANQYPEIKSEIESIEATFETIARAAAVAPPEGLGMKILSLIDDVTIPTPEYAHINPNNHASSNGTIQPHQSKVPTPDGNPRSDPFKGVSFFAVLLLLGASIWGYMQSSQNTKNKEALSEMTIKYDQCERDCAKLKNNTNTHIAFLKDTNTQPILMKGTDKSPTSSATVFWNQETKQAFLDTGNMPDVPTDKQYQLWAIVDGKPVDIGVFDLIKGDTIFIDIPFIEAPEAFAVTLEKVGGNPTPTMEEMYVLGTKS